MRREPVAREVLVAAAPTRPTDPPTGRPARGPVAHLELEARGAFCGDEKESGLEELALASELLAVLLQGDLGLARFLALGHGQGYSQLKQEFGSSVHKAPI